MIDSNESDPKQPDGRRQMNPAVGFGTSFAIGMALFTFLGHMLDKKTGHESMYTLIGIGLGLVYGAWELWKLVTISNQQADGSAEAHDENERESTDDPAG